MSLEVTESLASLSNISFDQAVNPVFFKSKLSHVHGELTSRRKRFQSVFCVLIHGLTSMEFFKTGGNGNGRGIMDKEKHPLRVNTVDVLIFELSGGSDGT